MSAKKLVSGLKPMGEPMVIAEITPTTEKEKVIALTVRMSPEYARSLKIACIDRGVTQNTFMLDLIRRELGLA